MKGDHEFGELLETTATAFRLGMESAGNEKLMSLIDLLMRMQQRLPELFTPDVNNILAEIVKAQATKNFLWIADLLEYGLAHLVHDLPR